MTIPYLPMLQLRPGGLTLRLLRVPLLAKLVGANAIIVVVAFGMLWLLGTLGASQASVLVMAVALTAGMLVNHLLVRAALQPLEQLTSVARQVTAGDLMARASTSPVADPQLANLATVINRLLDTLQSDCVRMRTLATHAITAADAERARISRELHDSAAQSLAAMSYELSAVARDVRDPEMAARIEAVRGAATEVIGELRSLSYEIHSQVLEDLGLAAALASLGNHVARGSGLEVQVSSSLCTEAERALRSTLVGSTLYGVAEEALRNVQRHARAGTVHIQLNGDTRTVRMDVVDDGLGFDVASAEERRPGMGLFAMRERLKLVGGTISVRSSPGQGTHLVARVPVRPLAPTLGAA